MQFRPNAARLLAVAFAFCSTAMACGYSSDLQFGDTNSTVGPTDLFPPIPGSSSGGGSSSSSGGTYTDPDSGVVYPATCIDGLKNGDETDVDCGGSCPVCAVGGTCAVGADCVEKVCTQSRCQQATGTDGVQNGDESDVDCGGTTGAAPCAVGQTCNTSADCETRGCANGICIESPSCAVHFGGDTCGTGEVEPPDGNPIVHESCCRSLPVAGFNDPNHPGKRVFLDKYEITAGRMREFLRVMGEGNNGEPNVLAFVRAERERDPDRWSWWNPAWDDMLPAANQLGAVTVGGQTYNTGALYALSFENYFRGRSGTYDAYHNFNCVNNDGGFGFPTYHIANGTLLDPNGQPLPQSRKYYSQNVLDQKSLNCAPNALFAAFCGWDGGQLATAAVLDAVLGGSAGGSCPSYNVSGDGSQKCDPLLYPPEDGLQNYDGTSRIRAPGRVPADRREYSGETWADLHGNLMESVLSGSGFALRGDGIGGASTRLHGNYEFVSHYGKGSSVGARCMRFKN